MSASHSNRNAIFKIIVGKKFREKIQNQCSSKIDQKSEKKMLTFNFREKLFFIAEKLRELILKCLLKRSLFLSYGIANIRRNSEGFYKRIS